jgi:hypothetical protein
VLAQLLPQLTQMIMAEPKTADFCGEILKFATAPYRAGRTMDGAINNLVALMNQKADQPPGPDPTTSQNQTAIQIEQMKVEQKRETDQGELKLKQQQLQQEDVHHSQDLQQKGEIEYAKIRANQGDDAAKIQVQNQKAMESREAHQAEMVGKEQDRQIAREKANFAQQAHEQRQQQNAQQFEDRRAQQQFAMQQKAMQPPTAPRPR